MTAMTEIPPVSEPADPDLAHCRRVLVRSVGIMGELQEMALECAKMGFQPLAETVAQVDTLARSIRRSAMLVERLGQKARAVAAERAAKRREVIRRVEDLIQRDAPEDEVERLEREVHERLDAPEFDIELDLQNIEQVIQDILHDIGLCDPGNERLWKRRPPTLVRKLWDRAERQARVGAGLVVEDGAPFRPP